MNSQNRLAHGIAVSLLLTAAAQAQDSLVPKQLAGPPAEFAAMKAPDPASAAIISSSALLPIELQADGAGGFAWQGELAVEASNLRVLLLGGEGADWQMSLRAPGSSREQSSALLRSQFEQTRYGMAGAEYPAELHGFSGLQTGKWGVSIRSSSARHTRGFLLIDGGGAERLRSQQTSFAQLTGQRLGFLASFQAQDSFGAELDGVGRVQQAHMQVTTPTGEKQRLSMFDDGRHNDGVAGDGVFGGEVLAAEAGAYNVQVVATGVDANGLAVVRTAEHLVPVVDQTLELSTSQAQTRVVDSQRLAISLDVGQRARSGNYRVIAQVWGAGKDSRAGVPVAWIGGMSQVSNGRLELGLDARWISLAGARAPFELREVRIEDADHFVTVSSASRLPLAVAALPEKAQASTITEEMRTGARPAEVATRGVGTKLLLVHGYCSGNVWGGVAGQFSNAAVFQDLNQNRSHDAFAQRIKTFGNTWNSYGIVAHSQGGAASLHLYTYYWSGLDNAVLTGGKRLIQSVGTPYQGTNLAGNLAAIGQVFGAGCGTNTNLTYSGAASWLAGIPTSSRAKVNYYTTSFTDRAWLPDWCHVATDLLLSDPDDGTTERAYGQLSGAVNQGHKTGWCHTGGMRDPAQTTDSSRNATMSANAAR